MSDFLFEETRFSEAYLIHPFFAQDSRGCFIKDYDKELFNRRGISIDLSESFESYSVKNVIRGLHFQTMEPQIKLVRVVQGEIYDVIVDLRADSKSFGKWQGFILSDVNRNSLYIPKGFAHGYCVRSETAIVTYKCAGFYHKAADTGIVWNDRELAVVWGVEEPIVSDRDQNLMSFREFRSCFHGLR